jgi:hypothetical protein
MNASYNRAAVQCSDPRLAQERGEPDGIRTKVSADSVCLSL